MPELKEPSEGRAAPEKVELVCCLTQNTLFQNGLLKQSQDATSVASCLLVILTKQSSVHFTHWWLWLWMVPPLLFMLIAKWNQVSRLHAYEIENRPKLKEKSINKTNTSCKDKLLEYSTPSGCCSGTSVSWSQRGFHA